MPDEQPGMLRQGWPDGWEVVRLAKAGRWLSGGTPSTSNDEYWGGDIPWISAASLKELRIGKSDRMITRVGASNGTRLVPEGTVLFVVRGMSLNNEFRIGVTERQVAFGQDCKAIAVADGIDPTFLMYAVKVQSAKILGMVETTSHGTGRLDTQRLGDLEIGIPLLDEQRRIVTVIDVISRDIETVEFRAKKLEVTMRAITENHLLRIAREAKQERLGEKLKKLEAGWSPLCDPEPPADGEWGVVRLSAITAGSFNPEESKRLPHDIMPRKDLELRSGDVLMARANGVRSLVGMSCVVRDVRPNLMLPDLAFRLKVDEKELSPDFLGIVLKSSMVRRQIDSTLRGTNGQFKISQNDIRNFLVPVPDMPEQQKLVRVAQSLVQAVQLLQRKARKLRIIRDALAEDLLSGRVRVSDL